VPLGSAAIGEVRPTDVLAITLDHVQLAQQVLPTAKSVVPAGLAAMYSFAEVVKRGADAALDIHPEELQVGLQPIVATGITTARLFLADALENGAGYAVELGRPDRLLATLESIRDRVGAQWEQASHASACQLSCPNCLRSWDNRRIHGALDWRLGLDVADLAVGGALTLGRWLDRGPELASLFVRAFGRGVAGGVELIEVDGLCALVRTDRRRGIVLGHPLWRHDLGHLNDRQADAVAELEEMGAAEVGISDLYVLDRTPIVIYQALSL
jgi:DEAD/DEAH box helicase domain-containing protein